MVRRSCAACMLCLSMPASPTAYIAQWAGILSVVFVLKRAFQPCVGTCPVLVCMSMCTRLCHGASLGHISTSEFQSARPQWSMSRTGQDYDTSTQDHRTPNQHYLSYMVVDNAECHCWYHINYYRILETCPAIPRACLCSLRGVCSRCGVHTVA